MCFEYKVLYSDVKFFTTERGTAAGGPDLQHIAKEFKNGTVECTAPKSYINIRSPLHPELIAQAFRQKVQAVSSFTTRSTLSFAILPAYLETCFCFCVKYTGTEIITFGSPSILY